MGGRGTTGTNISAEALREKQILMRISKKSGSESILNEVVVSRALRTSLSMVFQQHDVFTHLDTACKTLTQNCLHQRFKGKEVDYESYG